MSAGSDGRAPESSHFQSDFDFLDGQDPIARRAGVVCLQSGGGVRLHDVLRQGPPEHRADGLPALLSFALDALVGHRVQQFPNVAPADIIGAPVQNRCERPPQAALDFLCSPQTAGNPASNIKFDQLFDGEPRSRGSSAFLFLGDQVATGPRCAGQFVGTLARPLEAHIGNAPERHPPYLPRATNSKGQIPRLDAAWRAHARPSLCNADRILDTGLRAGRKASIERCVSETAPRVSPEPPAIFLPLFCSVRRNAVATNSAALSEQARTRWNNNPLFYQHKMHASGRLRIVGEQIYKGWMQTLIVHARRPIFFWRDLGPRRAVAAATLIVGAIFGCLFWPAFAVGTIWRAVTAGQGAMSPWREMSDVFTYILALSGVWTILLPAVIAAKFRRLNVTASVLLLLPVYYLLVSVATWVAMLDLALRPHYWAKTAHGRSRQRQTPVTRRTQLST